MSSDHPRATAGSLQRDLAGIRPAAEVKRLVVIINFIDPIPSLEWRGDVFSIQDDHGIEAGRHRGEIIEVFQS